MDFETVIGLEVHLQLKTQTKIFCGCRNVFGSEANANVCPVCLGLPGSLPVLNRQVLLDGIKVGLALNCDINRFVKFDRKNYYYPDLPKGYQISQYDFPIAKKGWLEFPCEGRSKRVGITRAHLEEDAGKLIHDDRLNCTLVDYNRTGTPLVEIVSEPDMHSPQEAYDYLTALKLTLSYLNVSDCDMEKGSLRCDANVSIRPVGQTKLGTKAELKNMNSFSAVKRAVEHEVERQTRLVLSGGQVVQETLLWDDAQSITVPMRSKEDAHDYRYFPEPDLVPFTLTAAEVESVQIGLPELPSAKLGRIRQSYGINEYDATILIQDRSLADFFEDCARLYSDYKNICNWINVAVLKEIRSRKVGLADLPLKPETLAALIQRVDDGTISNLVGKDILSGLVDSGKSVDTVIAEQGLAQISDDAALEKVLDEVIAANPKTVAEVKAGKTAAMGFFVGQAMKKMQGKANPKKLNEMLTRRFQNG
ncbi:MAG: Asp-tRNA(Asn)/Glu-tRNA(Gln) amidotransferase subunit GatB [Candidatus Omnitrophica bacterium]|nr:Asp-tRNA(Asn)/Glu-tRNA(Gln) amidotransferase subunit GatB [Candidatus Omnitrophota bacterium]